MGCIGGRRIGRGGIPVRGLWRRVLRTAQVEVGRVLILGEAGVGKRTLAYWLHHYSHRAAGPLAWVRCDGPVDPLAKTIFGWEEPGLLENAKDGTVVLEHVDALPVPIQTMLMRVVEQRKVWRVRGSEGRPFEAPFISTARRDPGSLVGAGTFRGDLRSRLSPITVVIPPLRARPEDIEPLARHFVSLLGEMGAGGDRAPRLSNGAIALLKKCEWSDNVHHLWKVLVRASEHCDGEIRIEHFDVDGLKADRAGRQNKDPFAPLLGELMTLTPLELTERDQIQEAIESSDLGDLARRLRMSRRTLISKLHRYGIPTPPARHG